MSELALARIRENKETKSPRLNLARCGLTTLPEELFDCVWLQELIVSNRIYNDETGEWEMMAQRGAFNLLRELPEAIKELNSLEILHIGGSGIVRDKYGNNLFYDDWSIVDISVIKHLKQLRILNLFGNNISDITVLKSVSQLRTLNLFGTEVSDISVLQSLSCLQNLYLSDTKVNDISVFQHLPLLKTLYLRGVNVEDISVFKYQRDLQKLVLNNTLVSDISSLKYLSKLESLYLSDTKVDDFSVLRYLPKLESLDLRNTKIKALSPLRDLPELEYLDLRNTLVNDISVFRYLKNLRNVALASTWISDLSVFKYLQQVESLELRDNNISDISSLRYTLKLKKLDIKDTQVSDISVLQGLVNLENLDLRNTKVKDVSVLRALKKLKKLSLSSIEGIDISTIQHLVQLQILDLRGARIGDISVLQQLKELEVLGLRGANISDISVLKHLVKLQTLDLRGTNVSDISVLQFPVGLRVLDLREINIVDISVLQQLARLEVLDLRGTKIVDISVLKYLVNLKVLDLRGVDITDVTGLQNLEKLHSLDLRDTKVSDTSSLSKLFQLQNLNLRNTNISNVSSLQHLFQLRNLDLKGTRISNISGLQFLKQLRNINLSNTSLTDITFLQGLEQLKDLDLMHTKVSDISVLGSLSQLQYLNLAYCKGIFDISVFQSLKQLRSISLRSTNIENITPIQNLQELRILNLAYCKGINDFAPLKNLPELKNLSLRNTSISDISPVLFLINKGIPVHWNEVGDGIHISFYNNPLIHPPVEIVKKGNEAILNYFRELEEGEETVYEAKLLIIGEAGTGKTTFSRKIRDSHAEMPVEVEDTTRGIDIIPFILKGENEPNFLMNIWDFGGQDVYHGIHQLFLTKRSLYVLLLDGRIEENPHYWLQTQELLGGDSPVMIILNQKGTIRQNAAFNEWKGDYNNLKSYDEINLQNDLLRIQVLTQVVESNIRTLPHFEKGEKLPKKWVAIRNRLKQEKRNYIGLERYQEICSEEGIDEWDRQDYLSDYLHDLGTVLHFSDQSQLKKILFLNPQWATDAIYRVLDHTKELEQAGYFHREDLNALWYEASYRNVFEELLALMEQFELCFPVVGQDSFIVPQLLPADKPEGYNWRTKEGELAIRYQYDFLPKGIVPRVVVRLYALLATEGIFWKRGALFEREGAIAEVVEHFRDKYIHIRVNGRNRRRLLTIIAHQIDEINRTFHFSERMNVHQLIPCSCRECRGKKPHFFNMANLQQAIKRSVREIQCQNSFQSVSVMSLLEETFWQDRSYKSYMVGSMTQRRVSFIKELLLDGQLKATLQELYEGLKSSEEEAQVTILLNNYQALQKQITAGTISQEHIKLETSQIISGTNALIQILAQDYPEKANVFIKTGQPLPDPVTTQRSSESRGNTTIYNFNAPVGSVNPDNKAPITQSIDQRDQSIHTQIVNDLPLIRQLIAEIFAHNEELLDEGDVEDIEEVLTEISENPIPQSEKQAKKWKRWLRKATKTGKKFVGGRLEKAGDSTISEGIKDWVEGGGLDTVAEFVNLL